MGVLGVMAEVLSGPALPAPPHTEYMLGVWFSFFSLIINVVFRNTLDL